MRSRWTPCLLGFLLSSGSLQAAAAPAQEPAIAPPSELHVPAEVPSEEPPPAACSEAEPPPAPLRAQSPSSPPVAVTPLAPSARPAGTQTPAARPGPPQATGPRLPVRSSGGLLWRSLYGHYFIPSQLLGDAFPVTTFGVLTEASFASGSTTVPDAGSEPRTLRLAQAAGSHGFALQIGMNRFLAAGLSLRGAIASGVTVDALELGGTDAGFALATHVLASVPLRNRIRVGLQLELEYSQNANVNVVGPLRDTFEGPIASLDEIIDRLSGIQQRLLSQRSLLTVSPRALLAVGLHRAIGLRFQLGYAHERVLSGQATPVPRLSAGLVLSWDLGAVTKLPLGLLTGYRLDALLPESGAAASHSLNTGLFYTGRPHLALGIEGWATLQRPFLGASLTEGHAMFVMKHYW